MASNTKVHTNIGHDRALCGVNPNRGSHAVVPNAQFVATPHTARCGRCVKLYKARGYAIDIPTKPRSTKPRKKSQRGATYAHYSQQP